MQIHLHLLGGVSYCNAPPSTLLYYRKNNNQIMLSRDDTHQTTNMTSSLTDDHIKMMFMNINSLSLGLTFIKLVATLLCNELVVVVEFRF